MICEIVSSKSLCQVSKDDNPLLEDIVEGCGNVQQVVYPFDISQFWFSNHLSSAPGRSSGRSGRSSRPLVDHLAHDVFQAGGKVAASVVLNHFLPMDTRDYFYYQVIFFFMPKGGVVKNTDILLSG